MTQLERITDLSEISRAGSALLDSQGMSAEGISFVVVEGRPLRDLFDQACDAVHYAGSCRRVGRLMRLALLFDGSWAGGMVLGSPFPNIGARDAMLGLTAFTRGYRDRGLVSPWARENREYWDRLQLIVNHARTFILPEFQGAGLGVKALSLLPTTGRRLWESRYGAGVIAFDTHCTSPTSRLFAENGWELVGRTKGFARDPRRSFSKRVSAEELRVSDNAALTRRRKNTRWWTWVLPLEPKAATQPPPSDRRRR